SAIQNQAQEKEQACKEERKMNELHQETITLLLDGKLVMQNRDIETREFLKSLIEALKPHNDDFHLDLIDRIEDYLKHIEWIPEMD
ncbi:MAG: hypothetical protein LUQ65_00535, partial [Candidatus Helarchaeota archaeon]|nr:hypothetical protein [Candidatus Helarchaeota archaeon]